MITKPTRYYSKKQENKVAKEVNGKRTVNSGATAFQKGDVIADDFLIECKTHVCYKKTFSIHEEWLEKNKEEAFAMGKPYNALCFDFGGDHTDRYYIIDEKTFKEIMQVLKGEQNG